MKRSRLPLAVGIILMSLFLVMALAPTRAQTTIFDDMEHGNPFGNGWFAFGGSVGGGGIGPNQVDLPPVDGGNYSLETGWGSGGMPGFFGGFGRTNPVDLQGSTHFTFWINPDPGQDYTLEINLQDDDNGDNAIAPADDDEFQYNCVISDSGPCAVSGGGWQLVSIPLKAFFYDPSYLYGGNGVLDPVPVAGGGNGQLINVVLAVIGNSGSDVTFRTDNWTFADLIVDDFEGGLPSGIDGDGNSIGFITFSDGASSVAISTSAAPPAPVPNSTAGNHVLQIDTNVVGGGYAGLVHAFENSTVDSWTPQDWSAFNGLSFWLYGNNSGSILFVDVLDNRNPGSTSDDAERFSIDIRDDFSGWQYFEIPWEAFRRKEIGNGAPNDGFTLTQVHGWAFGVFSSGQAFTNYMDDVGLFGVAEIPELAVTFSATNFNIPEGTTGNITVKLNRPMNADDPAQVSVNYATEPAGATPGRDYTPTAGTLTFTNGGPSQLTFPLETFDNNKYTGDKRVILRLLDPVDVSLGFITQAAGTIVDNDSYDPNLIDDFERYPYLWSADDNVTLNNPEIAAGDPIAVPGQGAYEHVLEARVPLRVDIAVNGRVCNQGKGVIPVILLTTPTFDATAVDHTTVTFGDARETHIDEKTGIPQRHVEDADGDGDMDLVFHFLFQETGFPCNPEATPFNGWTYDGQPITAYDEGAGFGRDFAIGQNWSFSDGLKFWVYGQNTGDTVTVELLDNRAADPGPDGWSLVWNDEFNGPTGTPPDPTNWGYEIGDGTVNGIPGWGNDELQYYTDSTDNAALDGSGNLVITAREADGSLLCYYGPCQYTSARLFSRHRAEFAYGRIESRILVPDGEDGLWPAFWSLGTDLDRVGWPQTGEIDFMEYVSRIPDEIFGTIHGPGYAGGASFGNTFNFPGGVAGSYHTITIEWQPDLIEWYVDGSLFHTAAPADVAPNEWVFNDPVFFLLNLAIGGNFGGPVSADTTFPQSMAVDYVRVFQGPDTAERFESSFVDDFTGWQEVVIPFDTFSRSAEQPAGAPDDGLNLTEVWGYGFQLPDGGSTTGYLLIDQVRLLQPTAVKVSNTNNDGEGSLRWALDVVPNGGTVSFDPALSGQTITLNSPLVIPAKEVTIDGADAPGITLSGGNTDRVLIVNAGGSATVGHLVITEGYGFQLAGGILNNGVLTLDHVTVTGNTMTTNAGDFWQGGGGIYNGDGATLNLIDSTVADNTSGWTGGGVYSFFNSTTNVIRSTISGNVAMDVGGGLRTLGSVTIENSTISGNTSTTWHGGGAFITDGVVTITNSTVTDNTAPGGTAGGLFVGTFTSASATLNLQNTIVAGNANFGCFLAPFGSGPVAINSLGNNVFTDATCNPIGTDQIVADAGLDVLANNGGPTLTHALLTGSPAIDAAETAACPATDQRGVIRPQGSGCDVGSFEWVP